MQTTEATVSRALVKKLLVKPREAAEALGISERTLFDLKKSGALKATRVGRQIRYRPSELERFAREGTSN